MTSDGFTVEWMFRLLDYEHYRISYAYQAKGLLIVNHTDQSVFIEPYDETIGIGPIRGTHGYKWWRRWLRSHKESYLP